MLAVPAVEAVLTERGTGLGVAEAGLGVGLEGGVVVGNDEAVAAEAVAFFSRVFKPAEEAFFGEQALQEGEVGFLVLGGHATLGIGTLIGQIPAPVGGELALALPVAEEFAANSAAGPKRSFGDVRCNESGKSTPQGTKGDTRLARIVGKAQLLP